jgi:hypothetical protein
MSVQSNSSNAGAFLPITSKDFATYTVEDYIGFTTNVITHVTGYAPVAAIKPPIADMQIGLDDLIAKNGAAKNRGRMEIMQRDLAHGTSVNQMRQWASYIDSVANGDRMLILDCGFQLRRASTPSTVPAIPANVRVGFGKSSGELVLRCKGGRNVRNFAIQYALSVDGPWLDRPLATKARGTVVPGLTPGTMYWFRMRANGAAGSSDWSMPACKMAI